MSSRTLYRLSGATLIVGSLLLSIGTVLTSTLYGNATPQQILSLPWLLLGLMIFIGSLLFVIGLPGMYLRQAGRAGVLGLIGFILLFFALLLAGVVFIGVQVIVFPFLAQKAPQLVGPTNTPGSAVLLLLISGLLLSIGPVVLGIATMRARVFPRLAGVLLIVSGVASLVAQLPGILGTILEVISFITLAVACVWCGSRLLRRQDETVEAVARPPAEAGVSR